MNSAVAEPGWRRLSPRMLFVHPVHEVLRQLPLLVGSLVLGSATDNPLWSLLGVGFIVSVGIARWFTTSYRIDEQDIQLRTGVLRRNALSLPRNRIRSVQTDARLLHRLLGLTVLRVGSGQESQGDTVFELDAVEAEQVLRLRSILLADSAASAGSEPAPGLDPGLAPSLARGLGEGTVLARWQPSWLRYSPLSWSGLAMILAAFGLLYQSGFGAVLQRSAAAQSGVDYALRFGIAASVTIGVVVVLVASVVLAVGRSLLTYGNLVLARHGDTLHLQHGLLRVREHTYDMRRLRGVTVREPLLVRVLGGARLDAVMTGVNGAGESSLLLPPCPAATTHRVLGDLVADMSAEPATKSVVSWVGTGSLHSHGRAAARRRWMRALLLPGVALAGLVVLAATIGPPGWVWAVWVLLAAGSVVVAADRVRALGHRVADGWLVAREGSVERRRDCIETAGVIGWTVRQTWFQRRAEVATMIAATAAGTKAYRVLDVPADLAWAVAAEASPWVANSTWAHS